MTSKRPKLRTKYSHRCFPYGPVQIAILFFLASKKPTPLPKTTELNTVMIHGGWCYCTGNCIYITRIKSFGRKDLILKNILSIKEHRTAEAWQLSLKCWLVSILERLFINQTNGSLQCTLNCTFNNSFKYNDIYLKLNAEMNKFNVHFFPISAVNYSDKS